MIVVIEIFFHLWLILTHRIPIGHEGLTYFIYQYFFLNNAVFTGQIPQWMPYIGHGEIASVEFASQASLGQNLFFPLAPFLKAIPFNVIFDINFFIDHLLLIAGGWLLAGQYYRSGWTKFFVVLSLTGSVIWSTQVWFNFHFYYAFPLILYFFHRFLETYKWRYFIAAGNLLAFQTLGGAAYLFPVASLTLFIYLFSFVLTNRADFLKQTFPKKFWVKAIPSLVVVGVGLLLAFGVLYAGHNEMIFYAHGRGRDNIVPLDKFLEHGGNLTLNKWLELILGVSPALDYTLYIGLLGAVFFILGAVICFRSRYRMLVYSAAFLLAISVGSFVAVCAYYVWPFMKIYRHLALISPIIKMLVIFIAGFGFERFILSPSDVFQKIASQVRLIILGFALLAISLLVLEVYSPGIIKKIPFFLVDPGGLYLDKGQNVHLIPGLPVLPTKDSFVVFRIFDVLLFSLLIIFLLKLSKKRTEWLIVFLLCFHVLDLYGYKFSEVSRRSFVVSPSDQKFLKFEKPIFSYRRSEGLFITNDRAGFLKRFPNSNGSPNTGYNTFAFADEIGSTFLINYLQKDFDLYLRAVNHQDFSDRVVFPKGLVPYKYLKFPENKAARKMSGLDEDKIQFYKNVSFFDNEKSLFQVMSDEKFHGDVPLILAKGNFSSVPWNGSEHIYPRYQVLRFDANTLELEVELSSPAWVYIAENFSKNWGATVNGEKSRIYRANLAYQALPLTAGHNRIVFNFFNWQMVMQYYFWIAISYIWAFVLIYLLWRSSKEKNELCF
ncbi:MAG: hypothetical protein HQL16_00735 [Candidatus Omnitrophica bacterium]|nr:hypothetical protein [Candidatus Omnitrophota bacterium]